VRAAASAAEEPVLEIRLHRLVADPDPRQRAIERFVSDAALVLAILGELRDPVDEIQRDDVLFLHFLEWLHETDQLIGLRRDRRELGRWIASASPSLSASASSNLGFGAIRRLESAGDVSCLFATPPLKAPRRRVAPAAWYGGRSRDGYFAVYVSCSPTMFTPVLYEPLIKPLASVLPALLLMLGSLMYS
jgi:hypothetical protein